MGSEQVAAVLRQAGSHVRLIVARGVNEPFPPAHPHAPIVPTHQLDDNLHQLYAMLLVAESGDMAEYNMLPPELQQQMQEMQALGLQHPAQIHQVWTQHGKIEKTLPQHRKVCPDIGIPNVKLTLNVWGPSYLGLTRSISWLLMPWLLTSPGHQQSWYWLCRICRSWSYLRKDFKYMCHINVE